jgi:outer membrane protein TolC
MLLQIIFSLLLLKEDEVVKIAMEKSPLILAEKEKIEAKIGDEIISISNFLPKISLNANYSYSSFTERMTQYVIVGIDTVNWKPIYQKFEIQFGKPERRGIVFSINQNVFDFFKSTHSYKAAILSKMGEIESFEGKKIYLENEIRKIYTELLFIKKQIEILEKTKENLEIHKNVAKKRYEEGFASELEFLQAELSLKNFEPQIEILKTMLKKLKDLLKNISGIEEDIEPIDSLYFEKFEGNIDTLYERALKERKDILNMEKNLEALKEIIEVQKGTLKPNLFFSYQYQYSRPYGFFQDKWGGYYTLLFGISWNIFDGFLTYGNIKKNKANYNYLSKNLEFIKRNLKSEIENSLKILETNEKIIEAQIENVKLSEKALKIAKTQYENGWISHVEYMDVEISNLNAKLSLLKAIKDYKISKIDLIGLIKGEIKMGGL